MNNKAAKKKIVILVIEDDEDIISVMEEVYSDIHFDVLTARTAKEAFPLIFKAPPNVIILDINLPDLDGFHVARELKNNMMLRHIPIIMLSGRPDFLTRMKTLDVVVDEYLAKPFNPQELLIRTKMVLERAKVNLDANPLTRLPGNQAIVRQIKTKITAKQPFAVGYADLNNFKAYNDKYGFSKGDDVISFTAQVITSCVQELAPRNSFVGHVGGDDFIFLCDFDKGNDICNKITKKFDEGIQSFYSKEDLKNGYVVVEDRRGIVSQVPLISMAIGMATDEGEKFSNIGEINGALSQLKKYAKSFTGSAFVQDRRSGSDEGHTLPQPSQDASKVLESLTDALGTYMPTQLDEVLKKKGIHVLFQTVIDMVDDEVIGQEGLIRGPQGTPLEYPEKLFQIARTSGKVVDLDILCIEAIFASSLGFSKDQKLFINVFPETLLEKKALMKHVLQDSQMNRDNLVIELSGAQRASDAGDLYSSLIELKNKGVQISIDSAVLLGEDGRHYLPDLNPDYVKLNMRYFRDMMHDVDRRAEFERTVHLLNQVCKNIICTKLESRQDANLATQLGIRLGQGFLIAHPSTPQGLQKIRKFRKSA